VRENQETFRYANERLCQSVVASVERDHRHIPFFCECADDACLGPLEATLDEFEEAHRTAHHFFILPDHPTIDGEEAIEENGRYEVVTKGTV
jgi:hypothetical protein